MENRKSTGKAHLQLRNLILEYKKETNVCGAPGTGNRSEKNHILPLLMNSSLKYIILGKDERRHGIPSVKKHIWGEVLHRGFLRYVPSVSVYNMFFHSWYRCFRVIDADTVNHFNLFSGGLCSAYICLPVVHCC